MSERPFFSVVIPTKNRPDRVGNAVRSVLEQTFSDLEIVVCDNSDAGASATADRISEFEDPRLRYVRTEGTLSMPDNWETAVGHAQGEYVGVLTDRSVYRRHALEVVQGEIDRTDAQAVSWFNDLYGRDDAGRTFKRRASSFKRFRLKPDTILDFFVNGDPKYAPKIVPKLMTGVFHRSVLDAARQSPVGRCCPPVCPDYTSGFLMLAHTEWMLMLDESLYVSCGFGTGSDFRSRGELSDQFQRDLGISYTDMVDRMPSAASYSHALVLNDLIRLRDALPDRFPPIELNHVQYYLGCLNDYVKTSRRGVLRSEDFEILMEALEREPATVQAQVRASRIYLRATQPSPATTVTDKAIGKAKKLKPGAETPQEFDTVFEAMAWDESNPRAHAPDGFLDRLPTAVEMKKTRLVDRLLSRL